MRGGRARWGHHPHRAQCQRVRATIFSCSARAEGAGKRGARVHPLKSPDAAHLSSRTSRHPMIIRWGSEEARGPGDLA